MRSAAITILGMLCLWLLWSRIQQTPQMVEAIGSARLAEANNLATGRSACGLPDESTAPGQLGSCWTMWGLEGPAYVLVPMLWLGWPVHLLPEAVTTVGVTGMFLTAMWCSRTLWWPALALALAVLCWQSSLVGWAGNVNHSWSISSVCITFLVSTWTKRLFAFLLLGLFVGWFCYESLHAHALAIVATSLAIRRPLVHIAAALVLFVAGLVAMVGVAEALIACRGSDVPSFSKDFLFRLGHSWQTHRAMLPDLLRSEVGAFITPQWSHLPLLMAATVAWALTWARDGLHVRQALIAIACLACVPAWFFLAPAYIAPHLHLMPRLLLLPWMVLVCAVPIAGGSQ